MPSEAVLLTGAFVVQPTRSMQAESYPWEHQVRVALPVSYEDGQRTYPVLWITDHFFETAIAVLGQLDLILVGVGPGRVSGIEFTRRRAYDFYPVEDFYPDGPAGDFLKRSNAQLNGGEPFKGGGGARFLDFLVDDVRSVLSTEYRMDPRDHALLGVSAGGWFVTYSLFSRPEAFTRYIAIAPSLSFCSDILFEVESRYAAEHDDLDADLFLGVGDGEMTVDHTLGILSSTARMVEMLSFRDYPSLRMTAKIFPGETHATVTPVAIPWGVRSVWGDTLAPGAAARAD